MQSCRPLVTECPGHALPFFLSSFGLRLQFPGRQEGLKLSLIDPSSSFCQFSNKYLVCLFVSYAKDILCLIILVYDLEIHLFLRIIGA